MNGLGTWFSDNKVAISCYVYGLCVHLVDFKASKASKALDALFLKSRHMIWCFFTFNNYKAGRTNKSLNLLYLIVLSGGKKL